jgi:hypothetical protein
MSVRGRCRVRAVVWSFIAGASLAAAWAGVAHAACVPLDPESTWLGVMARWQQHGMTPAQGEAFVRQGAVPRFPVTLWPPSGPVSLQVGIIWPLGRPGDAEAIEIDADGDGVADVAGRRDEDLGHVYRVPGEYAATIRVRDTGGRVASYASPVSVLTAEAFEAELKARWQDFQGALESGDLSTALECVHSAFRQRHEATLRTLLRSGAFRRTRLVSPEFRVAEMRYRGETPGASQPLDVRFQPDMDGIWRLAEFLTAAGVAR